MSVTVMVELDTQKVIRSMGLGPNQAGRKYFARRVKERCDKYVPKDTGLLKNTAQVSEAGDCVRYVQPYARAQFYRNYRHADPRRGHLWHKRMLLRERSALMEDLRRYLEGRPG